jgi:hypothetical protein
MKKNTIQITDYAEAYEFANRLLGNFLDDNKEKLHNPRPITIQYGYSGKNKTRTSKQNRYYWGVIIDEAIKLFQMDKMLILGFITEAMDLGEITPELVHCLIKMKFAKYTTTAETTATFQEFLQEVRDYFYHSYNLDIAEPNQDLLTNY